MNPVVKEIAQKIGEIYNFPANEISKLITHPPDETLGDYALPCFILAKKLKNAPQQIATEIAEKLVGGAVVKADAAGPYVNITIDKNILMEQILGEIHSQGEAYGRSKDKGERVLVDFSSPNIAKPFSIAHLLSTAIGNALKKIFQHLGCETIGINHLGDWGIQFGTMISAYKRWGDREKIEQNSIYELVDLYVKFNNEAEEDPSLKDEAKSWFKKLEDRDPEALELWEWFVEISLKAFEGFYQRLGVEFDVVQGESTYRDQTAPLIDKLLSENIATDSEGALIVKLRPDDAEEKDKIPPLMLKTQDGTTVYATRDLCAAISHWEQYEFAQKLYVVDAGQALHFKQIFETLEKMGYDWANRLHHVPFGIMLFEDQKMSTRRGRVVYLEDVLDRAVAETRSIIDAVDKVSNLSEKEKADIAEKVGVGAVIYANMSRSRVHNINFRWAEVLNFNGKSGPYIQYTHARMAGVLRKYEGDLPSSPNFGLLTDSYEAALAKQLEIFPSKVAQAAEEYEPFIIAEYLGNLALTVNKFYDNCRVLGVGPELEGARITLVHCAKVVLKKGLELLGIAAPERM